VILSFVKFGALNVVLYPFKRRIKCHLPFASITTRRCNYSRRWRVKGYLGISWIYIRTFHIYWLMCVKIGIRNLHIMILIIYEFLENMRREGPVFLVGVTEVTTMRMLWSGEIFAIKIALVKGPHTCVTECT
jgi:hypothetical protein